MSDYASTQAAFLGGPGLNRALGGGKSRMGTAFLPYMAQPRVSATCSALGTHASAQIMSASACLLPLICRLSQAGDQVCVCWVLTLLPASHRNRYIFGFLLVTTWLTPCILVLSLASTEHALPGGVGGLPHGGSGGTAGKCPRIWSASPSAAQKLRGPSAGRERFARLKALAAKPLPLRPSGQPKKKASKGLLLSLMTWIRGKAAEVMPSSTDGGGARRATLKPHTV